MDVRELMQTPVVTITAGETLCTAGETLCTAAARMRDHDIGALVVVGEEDELHGIVTERDLLRAMADGRAPRLTPVEGYTSRAPVAIGPDADCAAAARVMVRRGVRHLPVTRAGRPVGVLSARDLLLVEAWRREMASTP